MFERNENKTIQVGGQTVAPGESKWVHIAIDRLPTGTLIDIPVFVYNAKKPGPTLLVQAGLHGDEINGIEVVRRMLQNGQFKIKNGAIMAVPILNVFGFLHFSRDVPDGKDVNRSFPGSKSGSMAGRLAYHYLAEVMHQIDMAIDLHTGGAQRHNYPQTRYTAGDARSKELAMIFGAPVAFPSKLIKGSFRKAAFTLNKPVVVYEAGESMRFNEDAIAFGVAGIQNICHSLGMVPKPNDMSKREMPTRLLNRRKWLRAPTAGMFIPLVNNGDTVEKGWDLGQVSDPYAKKTKTIKSPFPGTIICINHQAVVNQGDALFHMGEWT